MDRKPVTSSLIGTGGAIPVKNDKGEFFLSNN